MYQKIENGKTIIADGKKLRYNGRLVINPTESDYIKAGYTKVEEKKVEDEGKSNTENTPKKQTKKTKKNG